MKKNNVFAVVLAAFLLAGCANKIIAEPTYPKNLQEAAEWQVKVPERAIVLMSIEANGKEESVSPIMEGLLFGNSRNSMTGISFAGSPFDVRSEQLGKLQEWSNKNKTLRDEGAKTIALGGFKITEGRDWALVSPAKYAVHKYFSRNKQVADMMGWARKDGKAYLVVDVNPGEVVYLGHIKADLLDNGTVSLVVQDRFDEYKAKLPAPLSAKAKKRLIRAPAVLHPEKVEKINKYNVM